MKREEINAVHQFNYRSVCPCCNLEHLILTQSNHFPEYQTEVYLQCECGEFVEFILPVN